MPVSIIRQPLFPVSISSLFYFIMAGFTRKRKRKASIAGGRKRRRTTRRRRTANLTRRKGLTGFPRFMNMNMNYAYNTEMNPGIGDANMAVITHNIANAFDPTTSAGDHQPSGWDQISQIYEYYRVNSFKISVQAVAKVGNVVPMLVMLVSGNDSSPPLNVDRIVEYGRAFSKIIPGSGDLTSGNRDPVTLKRKLINKRWTRATGNTLEAWTKMASNPASAIEHFMHLICTAFTDSDDPVGIKVRVFLEYNITFKSVIDMAQS